MKNGGYPPGVYHGDQFAPWNRDEKRCDRCENCVEHTFQDNLNDEICSDCLCELIEPLLSLQCTVTPEMFIGNDILIRVKRTD